MTDTKWKQLKRAVDKKGSVTFIDTDGSKIEVDRPDPKIGVGYEVSYYDGFKRNCIRTAFNFDNLRYLFED